MYLAENLVTLFSALVWVIALHLLTTDFALFFWCRNKFLVTYSMNVVSFSSSLYLKCFFNFGGKVELNLLQNISYVFLCNNLIHVLMSIFSTNIIGLKIIYRFIRIIINNVVQYNTRRYSLCIVTYYSSILVYIRCTYYP